MLLGAFLREDIVKFEFLDDAEKKVSEKRNDDKLVAAQIKLLRRPRVFFFFFARGGGTASPSDRQHPGSYW